MTKAEKLAWIRAHGHPRCPDFYALPGVRPNGCGPSNWKRGLCRVLNEVGGGVTLEPCGDYHDWRYWLGGTERDRVRADLALRALIVAWKAEVPWWRWMLRAKIEARAMAYYVAVRRFGGRHFNYRGRREEGMNEK